MPAQDGKVSDGKGFALAPGRWATMALSDSRPATANVNLFILHTHRITACGVNCQTVLAKGSVWMN